MTNGYNSYQKVIQRKMILAYMNKENFQVQIFSREILFHPTNLKKKKKKKKKKNSDSNRRIKSYIKNQYLKKYPQEMNNLIRLSLDDAIEKFSNNSFALLNKLFGFIVQKKRISSERK